MSRKSGTLASVVINGVPIESVSKKVGHKNLRPTQHFAKTLDWKVSYEMKLLRKKYSNVPSELKKGKSGR